MRVQRTLIRLRLNLFHVPHCYPGNEWQIVGEKLAIEVGRNPRIVSDDKHVPESVLEKPLNTLVPSRTHAGIVGLGMQEEVKLFEPLFHAIRRAVIDRANRDRDILLLKRLDRAPGQLETVVSEGKDSIHASSSGCADGR